MFEHDPETNRLSLKEGRREPWFRLEHHSNKDKNACWHYCQDCHDRYFETGIEIGKRFYNLFDSHFIFFEYSTI